MIRKVYEVDPLTCPRRLRPLSGSCFGRPTLRLGSSPIPRPNVFHDRIRARGARCARIIASRLSEPGVLAYPARDPTLPVIGSLIAAEEKEEYL